MSGDSISTMAGDKLSLALYITLPVVAVFSLTAVGLCCILCCSRKYRLNWYERTLLDNLTQRHDSEKDFLQQRCSKDTQNNASQSSLTSSTTGITGPAAANIAAIKQGLPQITIGTAGACVTTRKAKEPLQSQKQEYPHSRDHHHHHHVTMGSTNSTPDHSPMSSDSAGIGGGGGGGNGIAKHITSYTSSSQKHHRHHGDKRVSFSGGAGGGGGGGTGSSTPTGCASYNASRRSSMTAPVILPAGGRKESSGGSTGSGGDGRRDSAEFWVPPTVLQKKRAHSLVPSLGLCQQIGDYDEAKLHQQLSSISAELASSQSDVVFDEDRTPLVDTVSHVQMSASQRGRRRASMQDALDPTLINARIYEQMQQKPARHGSIGSIAEEDIGVINVALDYDTDQAILTVRLISARCLVARDFSGTCDPYCRVALLPCRTNDSSRLQTRVHKNTQNPNFDEEFMFSVQSPNIAHRTVQVLLYDFDQFSRDECVGQVLIPLDSVDLGERQELWRSITTYESCDENEERGDIMFSLGYLPSAERLTVVLLKARHLLLQPEAHAKNVPNPFVKVSIISNEKRIKKKKTASIRNNANPVWNEALVFNVSKSMLKTISLDVTVYSDNVIGNNEVLGKVEIGPESTEEERSHWNDMLNSKTAMARWHKLAAST